LWNYFIGFLNFEDYYINISNEIVIAVRTMELLDMKRNTFYRRVAQYEKGV